MRLLYGAAFARNHGDEPSALWLEALASITDAQCGAAFRYMRDVRRDTWPPNLPEFLQIVKPREPGVRFLGVPIDPRTLLESKTADPVVRERAIASCRRWLGVRS